MVYTPHEPIKAEKLVLTAAAALEDSLVIPAMFRREGIDKFRGAKDDTVNVTVDGVLPYRSYGWRNDRSTAIQFDKYKERKVAVTFGDDIYSAVELTDEQAEMDMDGFTKLTTKQTDAIGRGLESKAVDALLDAPYEIHVQLDEANLRRSLVRLKGIFDKLRVPGRRTILVDDDLETALLDDDKLVLAQNVGEAEAGSALAEATLGRKYKFDFVKADELPTGECVAMFDGGFIFLTAAPAVPRSINFGATASVNGVALRLIQDYDANHSVDRQIITAWQDFHYVDDPLVGRDGNGQSFVSTENHFVRAVKVSLGTGFEVEVDNAELATITGIQSTDGTNDGA